MKYEFDYKPYAITRIEGFFIVTILVFGFLWLMPDASHAVFTNQVDASVQDDRGEIVLGEYDENSSVLYNVGDVNSSGEQTSYIASNRVPEVPTPTPQPGLSIRNQKPSGSLIQSVGRALIWLAGY